MVQLAHFVRRNHRTVAARYSFVLHYYHIPSFVQRIRLDLGGFMINRNTIIKHLVKIILTSCMLAAPGMTMAESDLSRHANILSEKLTSTKKGAVLKGSDSEVYISLGQKHGVAPGNRFQIIRRGTPLKIGEKIVGYEESKIALAEIDRVREEMSIAQIVSLIDAPKAGDMAYEQRKSINRMVIAQFSDNQGFNMLTKSLQDKLITSAINRGVSVVERNQLEKVLAEQQLGYSGLVNIDSAKRIGQLLGADAMLLGNINDLGNTISISARIVDTESGNSLVAAETELPNTPQIEQLRGIVVEIGSIITQSPPAIKWDAGRRPVMRTSGEFFDDFTKVLDSNWESVWGDWIMANGRFTVANIQSKQPYSVILKSKKWKNLKMSVKVMLTNDDKTAYVCPRAESSIRTLCFFLKSSLSRGVYNAGWVAKRRGKITNTFGVVDVDFRTNRFLKIDIEVKGNLYTTFIDGNYVSEFVNGDYDQGGIGLGQWQNNGNYDAAPIQFSEVKVTPIN